MKKTITVLGSANVDFMMRVPKLPVPGETVTGGTFLQTHGGKGANQALACGRSGGATRFVACVGDDMYGSEIVRNFAAEGLDVSRVKRSGLPTGSALIMIGESGGNCIAVAPGANHGWGPEFLDGNEGLITESAMLVLQMEVPPDLLRAAMTLARQHQVPVLLNYAPAQEIDLTLLPACDILVVNEVEAAALSGVEVNDVDSARDAAKRLRQYGVGEVVVTLGGLGVYQLDADGEQHLPAFPVNVVDTTAAGDTFCGVYAASRVEGRSVAESLRRSSAAAALCVSRMGAQPSIPKRSEIEALIEANG